MSYQHDRHGDKWQAPITMMLVTGKVNASKPKASGDLLFDVEELPRRIDFQKDGTPVIGQPQVDGTVDQPNRRSRGAFAGEPIVSSKQVISPPPPPPPWCWMISGRAFTWPPTSVYVAGS